MRKRTFERLEKWAEHLRIIENNLRASNQRANLSDVNEVRLDIQEMFDKRMERWKRKQLGQTKKEYDGG